METTKSTLGASLLDKDVDSTATKSASSRKKVKLYTVSVLIVGYLIFIMSAVSGLLMCALWPLCEDLGGNKIQLGNDFGA